MRDVRAVLRFNFKEYMPDLKGSLRALSHQATLELDQLVGLKTQEFVSLITKLPKSLNASINRTHNELLVTS